MNERPGFQDSDSSVAHGILESSYPGERAAISLPERPGFKDSNDSGAHGTLESWNLKCAYDSAYRRAELNTPMPSSHRARPVLPRGWEPP
jgi:hypothetical protein